MMIRHKTKAEEAARFSKKWFLDGFRNLFWVIIVTGLIWVYADMEFTDTATISVTLRLNTGDSQQVTLLSKKEYSLQFDISGSKASLEDVERDLAGRGSIINCDVSKNFKAGNKSIPAAELLETATNFDEKGISIKNVQPSVIDLDLDTIERIPDIPVKLQATGATLDASLADQKVDILVPSSQWALIKEKLGIKPVTLSTTPVNLSDLQPGTSRKVEANVLGSIEGISVTPVPETVTFDVKIERSVDNETISVSVQILTPAAWADPTDTTWQDYFLNRQEPAAWRLKLQIAGPKKDLKPENVIPYIQLTDNDKTPITSYEEREVIVNFAPGTNLKLIGSPPKLQFRLEKRKTLTPAVP